MAKYLDYEGLATVVGLLKDYTDGAAEGKQDRLEAGENITISGDVISATDTGVTGVTATGTAPLTLSGSVSGRTLTLSGSVDTYSKSEIDEMVSTATAGGITKITAEGTSPLTLAAAQDGTAVAITGSVDLDGYYTKAETDSAVSSAVSGKQDTLTPGDNITISGTTISAKDTTYSEATSSAAGLMSASDKAKLDTLEEMTAITTAEIQALFD